MSQFRRVVAEPTTTEASSDGSSSSVAAYYVRTIRDKRGEERNKATRDLQRYLNGPFRDESTAFQKKFFQYMDPKGSRNQISGADERRGVLYELANPAKEVKNEDKEAHRQAATYIIVLLAEAKDRLAADTGPNRSFIFGNQLTNILLNSEEPGMELAARAHAFLIQLSKTQAAELVEKLLESALQWAEENIHQENHRLASAILLRELAIFTATAFFMRAEQFFSNIFIIMKYPKPYVREAAAGALHAALIVTSQREAKQKTEWYKQCYNEAMRIFSAEGEGLNREERAHCSLLVFNELLRIADEESEMIRLESVDVVVERSQYAPSTISNALEFLTAERFTTTVVSRTALQQVQDNAHLIYDKVMAAWRLSGGKGGGQKSGGCLEKTILEIVPRLTPWLNSTQLDSCMDIIHSYLPQRMTPSTHALFAAGLMVQLKRDAIKSKNHLPRLFEIIGDSLANAKNTGKKKGAPTLDLNIYVLLYSIVKSYGKDVTVEVKEMLRDLMVMPLSRGLKQVLHEIYRSIESLRTDVLDRLLEQLSLILMGQPLPPKTAPPSKNPMPMKQLDTSRENVDRCVLALATLGEFDFQRHSLQMFIQYIADGYLVCDSAELRLAAVKCCVAMLRPFIKVYESVHREHRQWVLALIHSVLKCLVSVAVVDSDVVVRLCVVSELSSGDSSLLSHLAQPELLELLRLCLRDAVLEMQEATVCLLGKIGMINPALILPRLRTVLFETIGQLTNSGEGRLEQHSARLIATMAHQSPKFMRPYMGSLLKALVPKMRYDQRYADVTVHVLYSISELAVVGGSEIVQSIEAIFPKLMHFVTDPSSIKRREAALKAIGNLCSSTAYVVDPYKDYPTLLEILISLMKTEMAQPMRRQTMRVLGTLGALDPYTHKVFTGQVPSATTAVTMALSLPMAKSIMTEEDFDTDDRPRDTRMEIIQWFNYEKCTLEEFYPTITIANLMIMLQNDAYTPDFKEITLDLLTIFRALGNQCLPQFVEQVVGPLMRVAEKAHPGQQRGFFVLQVARLLAIIDAHAKHYLPRMFSLIATTWSDGEATWETVIESLETIGKALHKNFVPHVHQVIPYLLEAMRADRSPDRKLTQQEAMRADRLPDRKLTQQVLSCIVALAGILSCHLHIILPPVLDVVDDNTAPVSLRKTALETVFELANREELSDYSPRIIQSWRTAVAKTELQQSAMNLLRLMLSQRWKNLNVFQRAIETALSNVSLQCNEYTVYLTENGPAGRSEKRPTNRTTAADDDHSSRTISRTAGGGTPTAAKPLIQTRSMPAKQQIHHEYVQKMWPVDTLISKEDWSGWLGKMRLAFIRVSSSASLRSVSNLADKHNQLAKDLFTAAFVSVWTELREAEQNDLTNHLTRALTQSNHTDVIQTILNLAEFMDHSEKGPLPITYKLLGASADEVKAYAKALRYKELEIRPPPLRKHEKRGEEKTRPYDHDPSQEYISLDDAHALITYANKLNLQEEAAGVIKYIEKMHTSEISTIMRSRWYEKLNDWEHALELLQMCKSEGCADDPAIRREINEHELKCMEALGQWDKLKDKTADLKDKPAELDPKEAKVAVLAARGAWAREQWDEMERCVEEINQNSQDGSFLRAVLNVHKNKFEEANRFIEKCRDIHDAQLTAMASESYERSYAAMVLVQELTELEEAMEYKIRPERKARIALLWSRRLQGCRQNVEQWGKLLMIRSLVLSPGEMHPLRVKFSSLCRKQGKLTMCRAELGKLLGLQAGQELHAATAPLDRPQLVLALCKQLWLDNMKPAAMATLSGLATHLDRMPNATHTNETKRLVAKTFLKLGEWTEFNERAAAEARFSASLNAVPEKRVLHGDDFAMLSREQRMTPVAPFNAMATQRIVQYYTKATDYDTNWHKAWHRLATAYWNSFSRAKEEEKNKPAPPIHHGLSFITGATLSPIQPSPPPTSSHHYGTHTSPASHVQSTYLPSSEYAREAVRAFSRALKLAQGSRLEDTLRLMNLWFNHGDAKGVYEQLQESLKTLPHQIWLEVVPQLIARLDSDMSIQSNNLIQQIVMDLAKQFPQSLVFPLTVASKSVNERRAKNASNMVAALQEFHPEIFAHAKMVGDELVRCAILWHEQWHEVLDEASRLYFAEKDIPGMLKLLDPVHEQLEAPGSITMKEQSFKQTYMSDLLDARKFVAAFMKNHNGKELTQAWELYYGVFKKIQTQLRTMNNLDLAYISPKLQNARDLRVAVPGTYDPDSPLVTISSFGASLQVINSKQRPRKMTIRGSNGREYCFLLKGHEDPRQDERVMQFFGLVNTLLLHNADTCRRNLTIQRYSIVALSGNSGLIGWVPDCDTLHSLVRDYREKERGRHNKLSISQEHKKMQEICGDMESLTIIQKTQVFAAACETTTGDDLQQILWLKSPNSETWFERRTNYVRSMACMSFVGYILGLGDRHPSNLMLDRLTGKIVHIDFGDCFEVAMTREKYPEKIPFRLTRMLIKAMEITGIEGNYRLTSERVLKVLRSNRDSLLAVLEAFVYDPLINWRLLDANKRNPETKFELKKVQMTDVPESVQAAVIDKIQLKLNGGEFTTMGGYFPDRQVSVEQQVEILVGAATLHTNLAQCYIGWCPFW